MKKTKLTPKTVKVAAAIGCGIFLLTMSSFSLYNNHLYRKERKKLNIKTAHLRKLETDIQRLRELIDMYKTEKERLGGILFSDRDIPSFLEGISGFAKHAGVKIISVRTRKFSKVEPVLEEEQKPSLKERSTQNQEEGAALSSMPIDIEIEGELQSLVNFLIFLERYRQVITLSNLTIQIKNYPILKCAFTLRIYTLKEVEKVEAR